LGNARSEGTVRFEGFELDVRTAELRSATGKTVRLSEQTLRILIALVERPGELVLREDLRKRLWPNDTVVEFEHGISAAINRLRQTLGDSAENPKFIETLAGRGYRWKVPVEWQQPQIAPVSTHAPSSDGNLIGKRVSHYRVLEILGGGSMGVVYKAEDLKLGRSVALKFLPEEMAEDPVTRERFEREARAASALDHPNICAIYEFGEHERHHFLAMQFLKGTTLREKIETSGPIPVPQLIDIAIQIARGLGAAHKYGILHRDIKPANIFVTDNGTAKLLDFGIAKWIGSVEPLGAPAGHDQDAAMVDSLLLTRTGATVGTAAYMSPEQAEGKKVDARSDIFSFGAVLYEMLTGRPAFKRDSTTATIAAILRDDVSPISECVPGLSRILSQCLRKDMNQRWQSMADVKTALEGLETEPGVATTAEPKTRNWTYPVFAGLVVTAAVAGLAWLGLRPRGVRSAPSITRVTFDGQVAWDPAISPDGKLVAYSSDRTGEGKPHIWVQPLPAGDPVQLTKGEANDDTPCFSADGSRIAFSSHRGDATSILGASIYVAPVLGGEPRLLVKNGWAPSYSPDGKYLLFTTGGTGQVDLAVVPSEGGDPRKLQPGRDRHVVFGVWSPDSARILAAGSKDPSTLAWYVISPAGGPTVTSYECPSTGWRRPVAWLKDNRILSLAITGNSGNLFLTKLSSRDWRVTESMERVAFGPEQIAGASATSTGTAVVLSATWATRLVSFPLPREGRPGEGDMVELPSSGSFDYWPSLSVTGTMAYLSRKNEKWNLWFRDLQKGSERWLTAFPESDEDGRSVVIRSDGSSVAYSSCPESFGNCSVFTIATTGEGSPERLCERCGVVQGWSRDGKWMATQEAVIEGQRLLGYHLNLIDVSTGKKTVLARKAGVLLFSPDFSPDGRWVAFQVRPREFWSGAEQIVVARLDGTLPIEPERWVAVTGLDHFDANPRWSSDGEMLYFNSHRDGAICLWAVRLDPRTKKPVGEPYAVRHFHKNEVKHAPYPMYSLGIDRIVMASTQAQGSLWMTQLPEVR
jgi:serine/threonine protein kinase/Tol biopolymer transport system component